jgi:tetratricopeptide (TPR) repeat protein
MRNFFLQALVLTAIGCSQAKQHSFPFSHLAGDAVYDKDSVRAFLSRTPDVQEDSSRKMYLDAVDFLKNKKDPGKAINSFLQSLTLYPAANTYYELGNAFLEFGKYEEALKAFGMAEGMGYKPLGNLLFKQACCYAELESSEVYEYVSFAVENGFVDRNKIFNDKHLKAYQSDMQMIAAYNEAMSGNGNPEEILWQGYSRGYPRITSYPYSIDSGTFRRLGAIKYIPYDYENFVPQMRDNQFSRDVGNEFFYVIRLTDHDRFKAVVYGCQSYEDEGAPVYYILATFTNKGIMIDKKIIAGSETYDGLYREAVIRKDYVVDITEYQVTYKKDEEGHSNYSEPEKRDRVAMLRYGIDPNGKITTRLM